ncbi:MAG TPA: patatin-like phospholipase family protein [Acidimicrobiales bacterium]|nr:patatin-like phospholipase family protein [Acidimicrobiales bacterium]
MGMETSGTGTVFALAGGGNLGAAQVGMLYALLEAGIRPDAIVGTSIGALNGAYLAGHADLDGVEELAELWASVRRQDVFPLSMRHVLRGLVGHRNFLFESLGLRSLIARAQLGYSKLEDAPIRFCAVATDLASGEVAVLTHGNATEALLASAAIPSLFPPVEIEGRLLVDGGVVANVPILEADSLGPSAIYVLPTLPDDISSVPANAPAMMQRSMALAARPAARAAMAQVASHTEVRVLPAPSSAGHLSIFDFGATRQLVDEAYVLTTSWLDSDHRPIEAAPVTRHTSEATLGALREAKLAVA